MAAEDGDSDSDTLPPLFDADPLQFSTAPQPQTLARRDGWSVIEQASQDGGCMRWMVCDTALSLDQTRVELTPPDPQGQRQFVRNSLRATSHQIMALAVAVALNSSSDSQVLCVLGGGGMALPMVLVTHVHSAWVHVVELHDVVA